MIDDIVFMTIIDAYQQLNEFFNENHVFYIEEHRKKVVPISIDQEKDDAAIICALKEMEKAGIVKSCTIANKDLWVLYKSIASFSQTIELNGLLCAGIASVINDMCDQLDSESEKCDPKNITEKDMKNIVYMASKVSAEELKK